MAPKQGKVLRFELTSSGKDLAEAIKLFSIFHGPNAPQQVFLKLPESFQRGWIRLAGHVIRREHRAARNPKADL